jgi:hypothetical protein
LVALCNGGAAFGILRHLWAGARNHTDAVFSIGSPTISSVAASGDPRVADKIGQFDCDNQSGVYLTNVTRAIPTPNFTVPGIRKLKNRIVCLIHSTSVTTAIRS